MVNKKFWVGMLVMVLVFGMSVVGCGGNRLEGTWVEGHTVLTFGTNTVTEHGVDFTSRGTYTTRGNILTINWEPYGHFSRDSETFTFSINGDILTLTEDFESLVLHRRR